MPPWDSADIENWLVRFVGQDLRYDPHYVQADGKQVLFLLVDPPHQGDPIYCQQAQSSDPDGKTLREGSVYVRRKGLTELALAVDIARLGRRAGATTTELDLSVDLDASETYAIEAGWLWAETRDSYIEKERRRLYSGLSNPRDQQIGVLIDHGLYGEADQERVSGRGRGVRSRSARQLVCGSRNPSR